MFVVELSPIVCDDNLWYSESAYKGLLHDVAYIVLGDCC